MLQALAVVGGAVVLYLVIVGLYYHFSKKVSLKENNQESQ